METLRLLSLTVLFRPYVFVFLAIYLYAASRMLGLKKAGLFTLIAWAVAYISEFSSVRTGFPFGLYHYIYSTKNKELWIMGVPFMDSLSFTFLSYSSWRMARAFLPREGKFSWKIIMLGAFLMTLLDVVIDPLALRGDRWFLGKIYYYPVPGPYFGVTIENFVGWFFVGALTMRIWKAVDGLVGGPQVVGYLSNKIDLLGPALYFIVLVFNLSMTFWIGEVKLGLTGVVLFLPVTAIFLAKVKNLAILEKNYP
ncbi:MAG: carotenoid biosynthesis protein [Nitrospirota bacterium]